MFNSAAKSSSSYMLIANYWILAFCLFHMVFHSNIPCLRAIIDCFDLVNFSMWTPKNFSATLNEKSKVITWHVKDSTYYGCVLYHLGSGAWVYPFPLSYHNVALIWHVFTFYILNFNVWQYSVTAMDMVDWNSICLTNIMETWHFIKIFSYYWKEMTN